jgi:hypothetical protein
VCVFFTRRTLLGCGNGFGKFDTFLKFFFQNFIQEHFTSNKEKIIKIVKSATVGGTVHDFITIGEKGIKAFVQQGMDFGGRKKRRSHWYILVKNRKTILQYYQKF